MKPDKIIDGLIIVAFCLFVVLCLNILATKEVRAGGHEGTECSEWASMVQVLVLRWQGQNMPKADGSQATNEDVKAEFKRTMGHAPGIKTALELVDYAYAHKEDNPVHVWKAVNFACESGEL